MTEEAVTTTEVTTTETAPTFKWVDNDGKFVDGWRNNLDEAIRGDKVLDVLPDVPTMAKNYVLAQRTIGKKGVIMPTEKSSPEEWDAFYNVLGRPKAADEYPFAKAKDIPDELWDQEAANAFKQKAWELGLTPKQVAAIAEIENERTRAAAKLVGESKAKEEEAKAAEVARQKSEAEAALKKEWGTAYDEKLQLANAFIAKTTDDSNRQAILDLAGNDPTFIRWVSEWGKKVTESKGLDTSQFQKGAPNQIKDRITQLQKTEGYWDGTSNGLKAKDPLKFRDIQNEITKLYAEMNPE